MPSGTEIKVSNKRIIKHPDLEYVSIEYEPLKPKCFNVCGFNLTPGEMVTFIELATAALSYHKLSQEAESSGS